MIRSEHREEKWVFPYVKYAPENAPKGLPLIVQLHGAGERGDGSEAELPKVDIHGFSSTVRDLDIPCILVMPQCPRDSFWVAHIESIVKFIEQITAELGTDLDRVYLTGLSMGGYGTWYTAMARPDLFAAIAPVCGGGMAWNAGALAMPVRVFHGVEDDTVSVTQSDEMVAKLRELGRDVDYTRLEGVGHNAWIYAYGEELLHWLLAQKRKQG